VRLWIFSPLTLILLVLVIPWSFKVWIFCQLTEKTQLPNSTNLSQNINIKTQAMLIINENLRYFIEHHFFFPFVSVRMSIPKCRPSIAINPIAIYLICAIISSFGLRAYPIFSNYS